MPAIWQKDDKIYVMFALSFLIVTFLISYVSIHYIKAYARNNLLDVPNSRSSHRLPTPRGGGLGIVVSFFIAALILFITRWIDLTQLATITTSLIVAGIGFMDDHGHIAARWRILIHVAAAVIVLFLIGGFPALEIGSYKLELGGPGYLVGTAFIVWGLNLFNFMDGIDGIAASEAFFVSAALAGFLIATDHNLVLLAAALSMSTLGFLLWNWPPAKIFMGDVGSGFLGFVLGVFILMVAQREPVFLYVGLILLAVFIADATYTLFYRLLSGQQWYQAHCTHAYQHAAKSYGHLKVVVTVWAINLLWLLPIATMIFLFPEYALLGVIIAYLPLMYVVAKFAAGRQ